MQFPAQRTHPEQILHTHTYTTKSMKGVLLFKCSEPIVQSVGDSLNYVV